jgi:hypothetical protein
VSRPAVSSSVWFNRTWRRLGIISRTGSGEGSMDLCSRANRLRSSIPEMLLSRPRPRPSMPRCRPTGGRRDSSLPPPLRLWPFAAAGASPNISPGKQRRPPTAVGAKPALASSGVVERALRRFCPARLGRRRRGEVRFRVLRDFAAARYWIGCLICHIHGSPIPSAADSKSPPILATYHERVMSQLVPPRLQTCGQASGARQEGHQA